MEEVGDGRDIVTNVWNSRGRGGQRDVSGYSRARVAEADATETVEQTEERDEQT